MKIFKWSDYDCTSIMLFIATCVSIAEEIYLPELAIGEWVYVEHLEPIPLPPLLVSMVLQNPLNNYIFSA